MKNENGFTLIEVVIVLMIFATLGAMTVPALLGFQRRSKVWVDGTQIFEGRAWCVSTKSAGASTEIELGRGPLCILPGDHYVSKDVRVETH
jgi:prepilin-type N-terminal cleavage/methylation domain-containing protein